MVFKVMTLCSHIYFFVICRTILKSKRILLLPTPISKYGAVRTISMCPIYIAVNNILESQNLETELGTGYFDY